MNRVICLGQLLLRRLEDVDSSRHWVREFALPLWAAAFLHDLARRHDGPCSLHGRWAVDERLREVMSDFQRHGIKPEHVDAIATAVEWHSRPEDPERGSPNYLLSWLLKDADALDRVRLGGPAMIDTRRFRFPCSAELVPIAHHLLRETMVEPRLATGPDIKPLLDRAYSAACDRWFWLKLHRGVQKLGDPSCRESNDELEARLSVFTPAERQQIGRMEVELHTINATGGNDLKRLELFRDLLKSPSKAGFGDRAFWFLLGKHWMEISSNYAMPEYLEQALIRFSQDPDYRAEARRNFMWRGAREELERVFHGRTTVPVFRGCIVGKGEGGMSWTTDKDVARFFTNFRGSIHEPKVLLFGSVSLESVIAHNPREAEIIALPGSVTVLHRDLLPVGRTLRAHGNGVVEVINR